MAGQLKKRHRTDTVREPMRTGTNKKHFYKKKGFKKSVYLPKSYNGSIIFNST